MTLEIRENFMVYETAQESWDTVKQTYLDSENTAKSFEIERHLHDLQQGDLDVMQYNLLTKYWQRLDMYEITEWNCPRDAPKYQKIIDKKRIYKFLIGPNKNMDG